MIAFEDGIRGRRLRHLRTWRSLFAIQPELLYSQKGFQAEELGQTAKLGQPTTFEIPVLLKAQFKLAMLRPAIYAGPRGVVRNGLQAGRTRSLLRLR